MTVKNFGIGCGVLTLGLFGFLAYRLANPWETFRFAGYEVQRNRITEYVQVWDGKEWHTALNNDPYAEALTIPDLARIKMAEFAFGPRGYLCGKAMITGDKPVVGRLAFRIVVTNKIDGKRRIIESERTLRCNVNFQPGPPQIFVIHTDMTPPSPNERFRVQIDPIRAE